jgi:predicted LPLAT superfamily acyltransferase
MTARWRQAPERSHRVARRLMRWIALTLGRRVARLLLHPIAAYFLASSPRARRASAGYLARALGRAPSLAERYRHFHHFAATVLDRVYLLNERFDLFDIQLQGVEPLFEELRHGRGALLIGAHLGSFEAARALGRRVTGLRVAMVMYEDNARMLNETLAALSPAARLDVIPLGRLDAMLRVKDFLADGGIVGVLADRSLADEDVRTLPFLGAPARFPLGPLRMAALLRVPVLFMAGLYLGGNRYRLRFEPLADFSAQPRPAPEDALRDYAACLERYCREAPFNWFNFFDFWADADAR